MLPTSFSRSVEVFVLKWQVICFNCKRYLKWIHLLYCSLIPLLPKQIPYRSKWHLLTGDKKEIYRLAKQQYFAGDTVGYYQSGNEFLHTENFILVDKHRRIRGVYNGTLLVEIDRIKQDINLLKKED